MIKPIDEFPVSISQQRVNYRKQIRQDIQDALDSGITKFEFDGDYNYKYLANYAREEAKYVFYKMLRDEVDIVKEARAKEVAGIDISHVIFRRLERRYFEELYRIYRRKREDRVHVYMEINLNKLNEIANKYVTDTFKAIIRREERRKENEAKKLLISNSDIEISTAQRRASNDEVSH